ncbi:uncharacterized protein [Panulirus ornatus]|uniref:uncharacterized protein n=1 Tax=Panulirus ornatus TaxID=150431 RepID=UPI003A85D20B
MLGCLFASCLLGLALATTQEYEMCYVGRAANSTSCMTVEVDALAATIHYHMNETDEFEDVETLEDYNVGVAASRVTSQEACYVRRLVKSLEEQVDYIRQHQSTDMRLEADIIVSSVSLDDPEEEIGSELATFCGDLPVYELVRGYEQEEEEEESGVEERQVSVTFTRCVLLCFIAKCFSTTLTVPTGATIIFGWIFG